jgi:DNA-binding NarL/FixJ family response regulator
MAEFEKNAAPIVNSYDVIKAVVERFKTMDTLLYDLDSRKEALTLAREKAVKAQTLFENLNRQCDDKIKVMEGLLANNSSASNRQSGEKRKTTDVSDNTKDAVLGLYRQGTTTDQIANMLKLSTAEVEFYIDSLKDEK